tara:strand:+ start:1732 stop:2532 length:801 start_codon:yes stop_codon:yes gene_type:complete
MATFSGTLDNNLGLTIDNASRLCLTLDTITQFDDTVGNINSAEGNFDLGGTDSTSNPTYFAGNIKSLGYYIYSNTLSLDAIYDVTFMIDVGMSSEDEYDLFDSGRGASLFHDAKGPFDGSSEIHCGAEVQVGVDNTSLDNITTYQKIAQQSTIKGRYYKFRCKLTNDDSKTRPKIHTLTYSVNFEKRTESAEDVVSGTGAKAITFVNSYYATPSIGISAQGLATGDYYSITSKSKTGFTIQFFNSGGSGISKTFDWQAVGYGLKST